MEILSKLHNPIAVNFLVPDFHVFLNITKNIITQKICMRILEVEFEVFPESNLAGKFIRNGNGVKYIHDFI